MLLFVEKMAARSKRSVSRQNYRELADVKLPKRSRSINSSKSTSSASPETSVLYRLRVLERDEDRVKVRYIGYGSKYDEWRRLEDIVDLVDDDNSDEGDLRLLDSKQLSPVAKFCLFEELACTIKSSLFSRRKGDPLCSIDMSFDCLHFEALVRRGMRKGTKGKTEIYSLSSLSKLDDLLGERWYIRGLNRAGDFCYVEPDTVRFYLKSPKQKCDYQLQQDGTIKMKYFGVKHHLVFQFVRSDGTVAEWSNVLRLCIS